MVDAFSEQLLTWMSHPLDKGSSTGKVLLGEDLLAKAVSSISEQLGAGDLAVWHIERGRWRCRASIGMGSRVDPSLLSDALDEGSVRTSGNWHAVPLNPSHILAVGPAKNLDSLTHLATTLGVAIGGLERQHRIQRRIARLEEIVDIAAQWRQELDLNRLLEQIAEAATRLLDCERASIFLWDKPNKTLIGRPALGVEDGELRIPEKTGVVGRVVETGEAERVNASEDRGQIDRSVDQQLAFVTRSLLCVPLKIQGERLGAFEVLNKRDDFFTNDDEQALTELATHAASALSTTQQYGRLRDTHQRVVEEAASSIRMIGDCPSMENLRKTIDRVAPTDLSVLILGENGTGKEVVSQQIHYQSKRRDAPFIAVNCAAIPDTLLESELFGHEKGSFTDARETRLGKFELASDGTLFLDEIGDMSLSGQAKLLRVLEEKVVVRVGGSETIHTDVRMLAATNQNLSELVRDKKFREDLFYRLNVVSLELPPLRERGEDITLLAEFFLNDFSQRAGRRTPKLTAAAQKRLRAHRWPGNVRELRNLVEGLAYLTSGNQIDSHDLNFITAPAGKGGWEAGDLPLTDATQAFQREYIQQQVRQTGGNMTLASERLGLHRSNLYRKMKQLGMDEPT
jgi:transcriptional regulator with GAF, ATPase, and Fis domain